MEPDREGGHVARTSLFKTGFVGAAALLVALLGGACSNDFRRSGDGSRHEQRRRRRDRQRDGRFAGGKRRERRHGRRDHQQLERRRCEWRQLVDERGRCEWRQLLDERRRQRRSGYWGCGRDGRRRRDGQLDRRRRRQRAVHTVDVHRLPRIHLRRLCVRHELQQLDLLDGLRRRDELHPQLRQGQLHHRLPAEHDLLDRLSHPDLQASSVWATAPSIVRARRAAATGPAVLEDGDLVSFERANDRHVSLDGADPLPPGPRISPTSLNRRAGCSSRSRSSRRVAGASAPRSPCASPGFRRSSSS